MPFSVIKPRCFWRTVRYSKKTWNFQSQWPIEREKELMSKNSPIPSVFTVIRTRNFHANTIDTVICQVFSYVHLILLESTYI